MKTAHIVVTQHAAERFQDRFDPDATLLECKALVEAAVRESRQAPKEIRAKVRKMTTRDKSEDDSILLYHFESSMAFVTPLQEGRYVVLTCYPVI